MEIKFIILVIVVVMVFSISPVAITQQSNPAITIATSNNPLATAYNNGRRMVRDSNDHRYMVYQDFRGDVPTICLVRSADGKVWSQPDTLAAGSFPSLAIDQTDRLFLVWQSYDTSGILFTYSQDAAATWQTPYRKVSQVDSEKTQFPVIEAGQRRLHIAWQQDFYLQPWQCVQEIFYCFIALDSLESSFARPVNISLSEHDSKFPSIAHNLAFEEGNLHLVWYDSTSTDSSILAMIMYRTVDEKLGVWQPSLSTLPSLLSDNCGADCVHPAVSVGFGEFAYVVWGHCQQDRFHSFLIDPYSFSTKSPIEIQTNADPFICVDDVYRMSSALVWGSGNDIYYIQSFDEIPPLNNYILVSQPDDVSSKYPAVCYKHFDQDSLDVVWTEGNTPPYKIMYRRVKKNYNYQQVERREGEIQLPKKLILKPNYPNPFNAATTIRYDLPQSGFVTLEIYNLLGQKVRTLVAENHRQGEYQTNWDGHDDGGNLLPSGIYLGQLKADNQILARKITLIK